MATENWVNIGSGNGLLPDGTKPLPKPMLTYHQWGSLKIPQIAVTKMSLKITYHFFHKLPGANELKDKAPG